MRFAVQLFPWERWPSFRAIGDVAVAAEAQGYNAVLLPDHLVSPLSGEEHPIGRTWPEVHTLAAYLAGRTEALRFCFYATVIPYRNPIHQASQIMTLDQVSNGRVTVVTGIGWLEEEFDALGVPFKGRGPRTDEQIRAGMNGTLCRCMTYYRVQAAIKRASKLLAEIHATMEKEVLG